MQGKINQLEDHFIICGFGRIGRTVAEHLSASGVPFVVVDCEQSLVDAAVDAGHPALYGNSTEDETLEAAGIERARGIICVTSSDAENVFVTLSAHELNPQAFIASRASTQRAAERMERAGAAVVVSPYTTAGEQISDAILRPRLAEFLRYHRSNDFELGQLTVAAGSLLDRHSVRELGEHFPSVVFVALRRGTAPAIVRPGGMQSFAAGDEITVAGSRSELERVYTAAELSDELVGV